MMGGEGGACDVSLRLGLASSKLELGSILSRGGGRGRACSEEGYFTSTMRVKMHTKSYFRSPSGGGGGRRRRETDAYTSHGKESSTGGGRRRVSTTKKLQLTREQTELLEKSFIWSNTLDPVQKQELAQRLNLRLRQVEVWFQNRRARTKMKQTEAECEELKRFCESLMEENHNLKMELSDLKISMRSVVGFVPTTTKALCSTCCGVAQAAENGQMN